MRNSLILFIYILDMASVRCKRFYASNFEPFCGGKRLSNSIVSRLNVFSCEFIGEIGGDVELGS